LDLRAPFLWAVAILGGWGVGCAPPPLESVRFAIADSVADGTADLRQLPARLSFDQPAAYAHLNGGWYPPLGVSEAEDPPLPVVWSQGPAAVVEVQLATLGDLSVVVRGDHVREPEHLPAQSVVVLWNDEPLTTLVERPRGLLPLRFRVPAEAQRMGLNRLVLLPNYWIDPRETLETQRALQVQSVRFTGDSVAPPGQTAVAHASDDDFTQRLGTVVTHYAYLPEAARLVGSFDPGSADVRGRVLLSVDGEAPDVLFDSAALPEAGPPGGRSDFDLDLSGLAGRAAGLCFVVNGKGDEAVATWVGPSLLGQAAPREQDEAPPGQGAARPNFLVVLFDTLRADATEPYGAPSGRTPAIARLGREGTLFRNAFSNAASTRVSVASMLTGLYPPRHGAVDVYHALQEEVAYLPELLSREGYRTVAVVNNPQVTEKAGFARGFDAFEELFRIDEHELRADHPDPRERASWTWQSYIEPYLSGPEDQPFFVYLHEIDPHFPYEPLPPYDSTPDSGYRGAPLAVPGTDKGLPLFFQVVQQLRAVNEHRPWLDAASLDGLRLRYQGEVAYMDAYLEGVLGALETSGFQRNTVVVFLSDHGEEFLEHGHWGHGPQLYDPAVRVPLIVSLGGSRDGAVVDAPVELVDLMPTLLRAAGAPLPDATQGLDLFAPSRGTAVRTARPAFAYADGRGAFSRRSRQRAVRIDPHKLIRTQHRAAGGPFETYELYDLAADPGETINLWFSRPVLGHALRQRLAAQDVEDTRARISAGKQGPPADPDVLQRLRALGYGD